VNGLIEKFDDRGASGVYGLEEAPSANELEGACQERGFTCVRLDACDIIDKALFLTRTASALGFPEYFGENWDAFEDCLTDFSERDAQGFVIVYDRLDGFLDRSPNDFETVVAIFADVADYMRHHGKSFFVILCGRRVKDAIDALLRDGS
jgi:RNAse (barnase) inhibitor barstar